MHSDIREWTRLVGWVGTVALLVLAFLRSRRHDTARQEFADRIGGQMTSVWSFRSNPPPGSVVFRVGDWQGTLRSDVDDRRSGLRSLRVDYVIPAGHYPRCRLHHGVSVKNRALQVLTPNLFGEWKKRQVAGNAAFNEAWSLEVRDETALQLIDGHVQSALLQFAAWVRDQQHGWAQIGTDGERLRITVWQVSGGRPEQLYGFWEQSLGVLRAFAAGDAGAGTAAAH